MEQYTDNTNGLMHQTLNNFVEHWTLKLFEESQYWHNYFAKNFYGEN